MWSPRKSRIGSFIFGLVTACIGAVGFIELSLAQTDATPQSAVYRLGIFPYLSPRNTVELYGPVSNSMSRALGVPVKLESTPSFSSFLEGISAQAYDIALIQPFDFSYVVEKRGYIPLARMLAPLVTQFFVRNDSKYHTLQELRGSVIAMPPALSANARMALRALHDNHLVPGRDLEVRYFNSHDSCIQQVWIGNASACGTAWPPVLVFQQRMQATLRPIYDTPAIPHILFVAHPRVPPAQREKLQALILGWSNEDDGRALLKQLGFPGFIPVQPDEYAVMRGYDVVAPAALATKPPDTNLVLGVFPYLPARQLVEQLAPLNAALTAAAGKDVEFRTAGSFGSFLDSIANGFYDIILVQPFDYTIAVKQGYVPLARMDGNIDGQVVVRVDSRYRTITDLKGQRVAMPPFEAAMSRLGRLALREAGLTPGRDITVDYRLEHDSCLQQVSHGLAAACITSTRALEMIGIDTSTQFRSIANIGTVPGLVFLAHPRVPDDIRKRVRDELLSWGHSEAGRKRITETHLGPFSPVNPADYQILPRVEEVR